MSETTTDRLAEIEGQAEPQPVQIREGRWRTRGGDIRHVTPTPDGDSRAITYPWHDARCDQTWLSSGRYHTGHTESPLDLIQYLGPIEPEPEPEPQPVHLQAMIDAQAETIARLNSEIHGLNMEIGGLQRELTQRDDRIRHLETLTASQKQAVKTGLEKNIQLNTLNNNARQQLEAVKAELVQVSKDRQALQIELDAREQVPQAVSDRFEEGWDAGTARAVETIAEWLEPFRQMIEKADNLVESDRASRLCAEIMQNLPHIMRTLTGLTDED